jgi:hypothetical protein
MNKNLLIILFLFLPFFVLAEQIDINSATLPQLDEIVHVGPTIAQRITDNRPYGSVQDLSRVKGIGDGKYLQDIIDQGFACVNCQTSLATEVAVIEETTTTEPTTAINEQAKDTSPVDYPTGVVINEILPSPEGADEQGEWIELYNTNNFEADLSGWKIEDVEGTKTIYFITNGTKISANGYLLLKRPETKITLNNTTDGLTLYWPNEKITDSMVYEKAPTNQSYNKTSSGWQWSTSLTPGDKNIILAGVKNNEQSLPNTQKSGNSNEVEAGLSAVSESINQESTEVNNPWFLFFIAITITIISALFVLFIKFKLKNHVRT